MSQQATTVVIFGASGDLTRRKLVPALYNLHLKNRTPAGLRVVGVSRSAMSHDEFRDRMRSGVEEFSGKTYNAETWAGFAPSLFYVPADAGKRDGMETLRGALAELEEGAAHRLYYLSVAPFLYAPIVEHLGAMGMVAESEGWRRVVIEKPFGTDSKTAHALNEQIHHVFDEHQVYRIDHYLGKETAQNILFFRFANAIFEPVWNRTHIDHVQISVTETVDVGHRAGYYDTSGVLRDMFQNHLLQLLSLVAMEPPPNLDADLLRNEKVKLFNSVRPIALHDTVRAQYQGYCDAEGVADGSQTATYAALKLYIDNWRWQGVPFYLRSGKALKEKVSEIVIQFRRPPMMMFDVAPANRSVPNRLSLCIQPDEGIHLSFEAKVPGFSEGRSVEMDFHYSEDFGGQPLPDAYERLLLDALNGDPSLFTRADEVEAAWHIIDPVLDGWARGDALPLVTYTPGTWGPVEADNLLDTDGHRWHIACIHNHD
ncbi:MAG: glucose-6-phosphate dehydrogenase [Chloroflexi bacterium]|nr:MAG: glucose-6-phosphate dehydrogenase [Chloroflexota bacterium]